MYINIDIILYYLSKYVINILPMQATIQWKKILLETSIIIVIV